jgi:hypothetical protein
MRWTGAVPMCYSTQAAGAKSPCERLTTVHRRDFTSHTRVSSRPTRRAAACVFTSHTPLRVSSLPTRRAAACVLTSHTPRSSVCLHFPHAAQRRASSLRRTDPPKTEPDRPVLRDVRLNHLTTRPRVATWSRGRLVKWLRRTRLVTGSKPRTVKTETMARG